MKYTTIQNVKEYIGSEISTPDVAIERWIEAMSRHIDQRTGYFPLVVDDAVTAARRYNGKGGTSLDIDNILEANITSVMIGTDTIADFELISNYGNKLYIPGGILKGNLNVKVTGKFGRYEEVPMDIEFACTVLVAGIVNNSNTITSDEVRSESIGRYTVTYASKKQLNDYSLVEQIIKTYEKITVTSL